MATYARNLGRLFNAAVVAAPADAVAAAITGNRVHLDKGTSVTFFVIAAAGSTDRLDLDLQQHTVASGGTPADLDIITDFWYQSETTLDADEVWTKGTQAAASEITDVGAASQEQLVTIEVGADQLDAGYEWVSLNVPDLGSNGTKFVAILAVVCGLHAQRAPELLANLNG